MKLTNKTGDRNVPHLGAAVTVEPVCTSEEYVIEDMGLQKGERGKETSRTLLPNLSFYTFQLLPFLFSN